MRYPRRPWYHPLGLMATAPIPYFFCTMLFCVSAVFPFRYQISEYYERQTNGPHMVLRQIAMRFYLELELMHERQSMINQQNVQMDYAGQRLAAGWANTALRDGYADHDANYWYSHQRDAARAEKLLLEIQELKAKVAREAQAAPSSE